MHRYNFFNIVSRTGSYPRKRSTQNKEQITYTEQLLIQAYGIIQRLENDSQLQELWDIPKHLTENEITKLNKIDEEYWEDKENIMRLMLLKFHSDSVENIDNKA